MGSRRLGALSLFVGAVLGCGPLVRPQVASKNKGRKLQVEFDVGPEALLGRGTYGSVHRGKELISGESVALKVVHKNTRSVSCELASLQRVGEEGGHPHVVKLLGVVDLENDPSRLGLAFELINGGELYESLVKDGAYSEWKASRVVMQVASALAFLHNKCQLVHADLKPENILLRDNGEIAICDFGSSMDIQPNGNFALTSRLLGTVAYAAPELLQESKQKYATTAVDVWSLGVILYVVLSGLYPFDPDNELNTDSELAKAIVTGELDFSAPCWNEVSDSAKDLITRMLEKDPEARITSEEILKHDWVKDPPESKVIDGLDKRLYGFLRSQKRLQDHVFYLMVDGSLKPSREHFVVDDTQSTIGQVYRRFDSEGKGFITSTDLDRNDIPKLSHEEKEPDDTEEKLYYSNLNGLLGCGERVVYDPNEVVFERGSAADSFYFVDRGKVDIFITDDQVASFTLGSGDFFGEFALINNLPRNATVRAQSNGCELIRFSRDDFDRLVRGR